MNFLPNPSCCIPLCWYFLKVFFGGPTECGCRVDASGASVYTCICTAFLLLVKLFLKLFLRLHQRLFGIVVSQLVPNPNSSPSRWFLPASCWNPSSDAAGLSARETLLQSCLHPSAWSTDQTIPAQAKIICPHKPTERTKITQKFRVGLAHQPGNHLSCFHLTLSVRVWYLLILCLWSLWWIAIHVAQT